VLIAPAATGICGSDLHARHVLADLATESPELVFPMVPGHEVAGEVVAIGPGTATDLAVGDAVTGIPFTPGAEAVETIGLSPAFGGGLAELTRFDAARTFRLPDGVDTRLGALSEPLAVAVHAFARAAGTGPVAVVGAGPIGLAIIAVAVVSGRGPIVAVDPSPARRAMAEQLGADAVHPPGAALVDLLGDIGYSPSTISPLLDGEPTTPTVFECVGRPEVVQDLLATAPPHSRVVLAGACGQPVELQPLTLTLNEVSVEASFAYRPHEFRRAMDLLALRPDVFGQLITGDRPLDATATAFDDLASDPHELKILIHPNGGIR
jgi:2-desacetyl-2-hydroxyethyl bacteriochlorophyllide A dehydrogenase